MAAPETEETVPPDVIESGTNSTAELIAEVETDGTERTQEPEILGTSSTGQLVEELDTNNTSFQCKNNVP